MAVRRGILIVSLALLVGCSDVHPVALAEPAASPQASVASARGEAEPADTQPTEVPSTDADDTRVFTGTVVSALSGSPLAGARVASGELDAVTGADGSFELIGAASDAALTVERPAWMPTEVSPAELARTVDGEPLTVGLEPRIVRGLRVAPTVAADPERYDELLALADETSVNALVFDTKDETDHVRYRTEVAFATEIDAVDAVYDPEVVLAEAEAHDLYTITRIVTFEDASWAANDPEAKLAGVWVDAADPVNWRYPIDLAVEACRLGFDEVQFDYVRFPSGRTAEVAANLVPPTAEARAEAIGSFLDEARASLLAEGCAVSAAIFGIVMSSETDERLGQTPERVSAAVDAVSPMLYPSHYGPGWLGFSDPNEHPGPVIAHALDTGSDRVGSDAVVRPWLQGFYYNGAEVLAQIDEAEARGAGWIIWNASGRYERDWLPSG